MITYTFVYDYLGYKFYLYWEKKLMTNIDVYAYTFDVNAAMPLLATDRNFLKFQNLFILFVILNYCKALEAEPSIVFFCVNVFHKNINI